MVTIRHTKTLFLRGENQISLLSLRTSEIFNKISIIFYCAPLTFFGGTRPPPSWVTPLTGSYTDSLVPLVLNFPNIWTRVQPRHPARTCLAPHRRVVVACRPPPRRGASQRTAAGTFSRHTLICCVNLFFLFPSLQSVSFRCDAYVMVHKMINTWKANQSECPYIYG